MSSCKSQVPLQTRLNHAVKGKKGHVAGKLRLNGLGSHHSLLDLIPEDTGMPAKVISNRHKEPQTPTPKLFKNEEFGQLHSKSEEKEGQKKFP